MNETYSQMFDTRKTDTIATSGGNDQVVVGSINAANSSCSFFKPQKPRSVTVGLDLYELFCENQAVPLNGHSGENNYVKYQ